MDGDGSERAEEPSGPHFHFIGGNLALDFHNTALWERSEAASHEHPLRRAGFIGTYNRLVAWGVQSEAISPREAELLRREAEVYPEEAERALEAAFDLRDVLHHVFSAIARGDRPEVADLARLNAALADVLSRLRILPEGDEYRWGWSSGGSLTMPLWPVTRAAAELLTSPDIHRVRRCGGDPCGFLFVDRSRRGRRWCDMSMCGSRAKSRAYYARSRGRRTTHDGAEMGEE